MRVRWRGLELPSRVVKDETVSTDTYGRFTAEPFERGFGTTVGNSLRRILLSSLEGAAVTHVRIKGAEHEFTSLTGIMEDATDIILNVKKLTVKLDADDVKEMRLSTRKAGPITAGMIEADPAITVINKDLVLCTLTEDLPFEMTFKVAKGRGYVPAVENIIGDKDEQEIGLIAVDSIYSPVVRVRYGTEDARVGQKTDYDRLVLEIWTNGTLTPEMALVEASKILRKHLNPFVQYFELGSDTISDDALTTLETSAPTLDPDVQQKLNMTIQELDLSVRAANCLELAKIQTVRDLVRKSEADLLKVRSFGKTSLREIKRKLTDMGLRLNMDVETLGMAPEDTLGSQEKPEGT
jgi:DNA-directed RNA polymerase subunit alpha